MFDIVVDVFHVAVANNCDILYSLPYIEGKILYKHLPFFLWLPVHFPGHLNNVNRFHLVHLFQMKNKKHIIFKSNYI